MNRYNGSLSAIQSILLDRCGSHASRGAARQRRSLIRLLASEFKTRVDKRLVVDSRASPCCPVAGLLEKLIDVAYRFLPHTWFPIISALESIAGLLIKRCDLCESGSLRIRSPERVEVSFLMFGKGRARVQSGGACCAEFLQK